MKLDEAARALIGAGTDATLVTINPDGSPQVSLVWVTLQSTPEGDELVSAHLSDNYKKVRNIRRDSRVAVTITSRAQEQGLTQYLSIAGTARIVAGGAPELLKELAAVMLGPDSGFPPEDTPEGFLTRITLDRVGGTGPWAS
ncbi:MAG: PPOX class F420-dependent oxidoreductase [Mycobacterium sp.]